MNEEEMEERERDIIHSIDETIGLMETLKAFNLMKEEYESLFRKIIGDLTSKVGEETYQHKFPFVDSGRGQYKIDSIRDFLKGGIWREK